MDRDTRLDPDGRARPPFLTPLWRRVRRAVLVRRRLLAALLAALAVLSGVRAAAAPPPLTTPVVVAAADLAGGDTVSAGDLRTVDYPEDAVPEGASGRALALVGRVLAAPLRAGEPVTDVRLVAPGLLEGYPGMVAAPVRVADAGAVSLLGVGDRVDLVAVPPEGGDASVVAAGAPVVALPRTDRADDGLVSGGLVVVAVPGGVALDLARASVAAVLSVVLSR